MLNNIIIYFYNLLDLVYRYELSETLQGLTKPAIRSLLIQGGRH